MLLLALGLGACSAPSEPVPELSLEEKSVLLIEQVMTLAADAERGHEVFKGNCIHCHGDQSSGEPPTDFDLGDENPRRFRGYRELTHRQHVEVIVRGYVSKQSGHQNMPAFILRLKPQRIADVAAYEQRIMAQDAPYRNPETRSWMGLPPHVRSPVDTPLPLSGWED